MTRNKANAIAATILTTLAEIENGEMREGPAYAAMMGILNLDEFQMVLGFLATAGLVTRGPQFLITITDAGRAMAAKINAAIAKV